MASSPKFKTVFGCQACGFESSKWLGRCPDCGEMLIGRDWHVISVVRMWW